MVSETNHLDFVDYFGIIYDFIATLLLSQGTLMLLAGGEMTHTQWGDDH